MSDTCSVCQDGFDNPKFLHCGHTFCCKCIESMIVSSKGPYTIKCPLCRKETSCSERGTRELMGNFFVKDNIFSAKISTCADCKRITRTKPCENCQIYICDNCIPFHMKTRCGGKEYGLGMECVDTKVEEEEDSDDESSHQFLSEEIQTKYLFELDGRIVIPNDQRCGVLNINLSLITSFDENILLTIPNGERVFMYNENGEEILREPLPFKATCISSSIAGHVILIQDRQYVVYKYQYGNLVPMFSAPSVSPKAISSFNNGRIIIVGLRLFHIGLRAQETSEATFCIYEYDGSIVNEMSIDIGEHVLACPTSVCVNLSDNDFFVGDEMQRQVVSYREDGTYVSCFEFPNCNDATTLDFINSRSLFPMSIAYSQNNDLLFASYLTSGDNGILVLSASLDLLGHFSSASDIGIPGGMLCDNRGRLCMGDIRDGIIRIFKLSRFINRI